jgi:hypothetical protein
MRSYKKSFYPGNGCFLPADEREGLLDAYASGELDSEEQQQLANHVAQCSRCQQTLVELREYHRLLGELFSDTPVPEGEHETSSTEQPGPTPLPPAVTHQQAHTAIPSLHRQRFARPPVRILLVAIALLVIVANVGFVHFFLQMTQKAATPKLHTSPTAPATSSATPTGMVGEEWQTILTLPPAPALPGSDQYPSYPPSIPSITSSPADPTTLYLCRLHLTRGASLPFTVPHLLYRSDDLGAHWQELPLPAPAANCEIRPDPVQANIVVLEDNRNGAFVSRDRGQHWQRIPPPPGANGSDAWRLQATPVAGRIYVSGYWTSDLHTWTRWYPLPLSSQDPGNPRQSQGPIDLRFLVDPHHPDTIYTDMSPTCPGTRLPAGFPSAGDVLCRSDNDGRSWRLLAGIPVVPGSFDPSYCLVQGKPDVLYVQGVQPSDVTKGGLMRSTNGGASWQIIHLFQDPQVGVSLKCSALNDPYPYSFDSQDPFFTYDVSKSHFAIVGDAQNNTYDIALTGNGTFYYASETPAQDGQTTLPAGIAILSRTGWTRIAPLPPAYAVGRSQHHAPDIYRMMVQVLTSNAGPPVILAYDDGHLYRYMDT